MTRPNFYGHTPIPWEVTRDGVYLVIDSAAAGKRIGVMKYVDGASPERDANAAFIVVACNAYYRMRDENAALRQTLVNFIDYGYRREVAIASLRKWPEYAP